MAKSPSGPSSERGPEGQSAVPYTGTDISHLPVYPEHAEPSQSALPEDPIEAQEQRWARLGRLVGRALGGLGGGLAAALDAYDRWGLAGLLAGAVLGALIGGFLLGEVAAFFWGLRGRWWAAWRVRRAKRLGDPLKKEEDPGWQGVHNLMRDKGRSHGEER
jgi:hypothetical protein